MESIKKQGWPSVKAHHTGALPDLKQAVFALTNAGFDVPADVINDLAHRAGKTMKEQARRLSKEDASHIKIPAMRTKAIQEGEQHLIDVIDSTISFVERVVGKGGMNPLDCTAFIASNETVTISDEWLAAKDKEYTIRISEKRGRALQLMDDVERSINALNVFVKDNRAFASGMGTVNNLGRCLMYVNDNLALVKCLEELEHITD